jgi:hypothetical protein
MTVQYSNSKEMLQPNYLKEWRGFVVTDEVQSWENVEETKKRLVEMVDRWHKELNPQLYQEQIKDIGVYENYIEATTPKEDATQRMINAINSCTELKVLETFKLLVKNNPVFLEAYNNKLKSFQ